MVIGAMFNQAILGKWFLCIEWEDESLGKLVVVSQFGIGPGGWCTILGRLLFEIEMWKGIAKDWENFEHTRLVVGMICKFLPMDAGGVSASLVDGRRAWDQFLTLDDLWKRKKFIVRMCLRD